MPFLFEKKTGKRVFFEYSVDARDAIGTGHWTDQEPEGYEPPVYPPPPDQLKETDVLTEKARLGTPLDEGDRESVGKFAGIDPTKDAEGVSHVVGGEVTGEKPPLVDPVPDRAVLFDPSHADRNALFAWLRSQAEFPANSTGTENLRALAFEKLGLKAPTD